MMNSTIQTKNILESTRKYIQSRFEGEGSGHDWWHILRVRNLALHIAEIEGGNIFLIEMAALLHDLDDWKIAGDNQMEQTKSWLKKMNLPPKETQIIVQIINEVSFKGAGVSTSTTLLEAAIVQDADRIDAIGAIGIARAFAYGGHKGRLLHDPAVNPVLHDNYSAYKNNNAPTINHFYEKLLLLKDRINTNTAKKIAEDRHRFMETYLERFFDEWDGKI